MITLLIKDVTKHIETRHGPTGEDDSRFDAGFLSNQGGLGKVAKAVVDNGVSAVEKDKSGRTVHHFYYNFNTKTGTGVAVDKSTVSFKGVHIVGTVGTDVLFIETMYPKGVIKT
ncbi:MAG: hypothetical protein AAF334_00250 [Pseudomonadota bacterium]